MNPDFDYVDRLTAFPENACVKCPACSDNEFIRLITRKELGRNYMVCPSCNYHFRMTVSQRISQLSDEGSFSELFTNLCSVNPIDFPDYEKKIKRDVEKTNRNDCAVFGRCQIDGIETILGIIDLAFMGGSLGSVSGEKIAMAAELCISRHLPLVIVTASGGARMQEGLIALMQMAKTSGSIKLLDDAGLPFITVYADQTTGGTYASYAGSADIVLAEPRARIRFAGQRVLEKIGDPKQIETLQKMEKAEEQFRRGKIDRIVPRQELKKTLGLILLIWSAKKPPLENSQPIEFLPPDRQSTKQNIAKEEAEIQTVFEKLTVIGRIDSKFLDEIDQARRAIGSLGLNRRQRAECIGRINQIEQEYTITIETLRSDRTPLERLALARHPDRPQTLDYAKMIFDAYIELHGDRKHAEDAAIVGGLALLEMRPVIFLGHHKGHNTKERIHHNFGSAGPSGYRKAWRLMLLAEKLGLPVISFIDTPAADCRPDAEAEGIAQAIAENIKNMFGLKIPTVSIVIGEGGSGGALGIGVTDSILMLENSIYSVIPPEGCANILWPGGERTVAEAATALNLTSYDAVRMGIAEMVLPEPLEGAQQNAMQTAETIRRALHAELKRLETMKPNKLVGARIAKYRQIGVYQG